MTAFRSLCVGVALTAGLGASPDANAWGLEDIGRDVGNCFHGGCDPFHELNKRVDDGIRSKSASVAEPVKEAFIEAMNVLFDQKLNPMIDKINVAATARLDQVGSLMAEAQAGIDEIIDHAATRANQLVDQSAATVRSEIIETSFREADALATKVSAQISALIRQIDCQLFDGNASAIDVYIDAQFDLLPNVFDSCSRDQGYFLKTPEPTDWIKLYRIRECQLNKELQDSEDVAAVRDNYARLVELARKFYCIVDGDPAHKLLREDSARYGYNFELWSQSMM